MILESFVDLVRERRLDQRLPAPGESLVLRPLPGSSSAALAAALTRSSDRLVVVAAATPEAAEAVVSDLATLDAGERTSYYPQREALPHEDTDPHVEITGQRVQAIADLLAGRCRVLVTTARALVERGRLPGEGPATLELEEGIQVQRDGLASRLEAMGFEPVHTVEELGEFAVRGGIVDFFPFGSDRPVRLELWGDEIASLRRFDPGTQRSVGALERIEILPLTLDADGAAPGDGDAETGTPRRAAPEEDAAGRRSLLEILPDSALLFDLAPDDGPRRRRRLWDETAQARREGRGELPPEALLVPPEDASRRLSELGRLLASDGETEGAGGRTSAEAPAGDGPHASAGDEPQTLAGGAEPPVDGGDGPSADGGAPAAEPVPVLDLGLRPPPTVDRQMTVLVDEISTALDAGDRVLVLCDNEGQIDRLEEILEERGGASLARRTALGLGTLSGGVRVPGEPGLLVLTDHEIFRRRHRLRRRGRSRGGSGLESVASLTSGDYVVHLDHGIGRYRGLERVEIGGEAVETLKIEYADGEVLRVPHYRVDLVEKWSATDGETEKPPRVHKLGGKRWKKLKEKTVDSIQETAAELLELYAHRQVTDGHAFSGDTNWQKEFESAFLYEETPDQQEAWEEVKADMEEPHPMDRLICGDVGFGKTEVAMRAAFKAVQDGKQVAVLAPTTVLVDQHLHTFRERMAAFPVVVEALSRFQSRSAQEEVLSGLDEGTVDVVVGTHRLLSDDVDFLDLGLLVVDEEQRFGVRQKEKLKQYKRSVDVLSMTATPIPRTLQLALGGLRDLSVIETPPRDRRPVITHVLEWSDPILQDAMRRELDRGGQVFFVHDRVRTVDTLAERVRRLMPEAEVAVAHGRMGERELEETMDGLMEGSVDVLVSTTIIENGLDVPTANTMIVHRADMFGLSQLYQLRGRVGRSHHRAYCYLLVPPDVTPEAEKRLRILEHHTELGAGYEVALKDLELRGAGNLLGADQSGFAQAVGFETYRRLLEKTVARLKGEHETSDEPPQVSLGGDAYLPDDYVGDAEQKMNLYRRISGLEEVEAVDEMRDELRDRFGPVPEPAEHLLASVKLKILGTTLRTDWIRVSNGTARINFRDDAMPRMKLLRDAFHDRQLDVEVRRAQPLSLVLERAGVEPVLPTLVDALSVLARTEDAGAAARAS